MTAPISVYIRNRISFGASAPETRSLFPRNEELLAGLNVTAAGHRYYPDSLGLRHSVLSVCPTLLSFACWVI